MKLRMPRPLTLFLLTLALLAAAFGLRVAIPACRQRTAVEHLMEYGYPGDVRSVGPEWLREFIGVRWMLAFDEIRGFRFNGDGDRELRLDGVSTMRRILPVVDDDGLAWLRRLPSLKRLELVCTNVSDSGLEHVCGLPALERLILDGTDVSDKCIPMLQQLPNLKELSVRGTRVSEAGVMELECAIPGLKVTR